MFLEQLRTNFDNSVHNCAVSVGSTDLFFQWPSCKEDPALIFDHLWVDVNHPSLAQQLSCTVAFSITLTITDQRCSLAIVQEYAREETHSAGCKILVCQPSNGGWSKLIVPFMACSGSTERSTQCRNDTILSTKTCSQYQHLSS